MNWDRFDRVLQRWANIVTIVGIVGGAVALWVGYRSLSTDIQNLQYTQQQVRPRLIVSGEVFIDKNLSPRSRLVVTVINRGGSPARDVVVHLEAVFKDESVARYLGAVPLVDDIDTAETRSISGPGANSTLVELLKRAMINYDPRQHGPSKVVVYLEYKDLAGYVYGGRDDRTGKDRPGIVRRDLKTVVE